MVLHNVVKRIIVARKTDDARLPRRLNSIRPIVFHELAISRPFPCPLLHPVSTVNAVFISRATISNYADSKRGI